MTLGEAVALLGKWSREELKRAIASGVALPSTGAIIRLQATPIGHDYDIAESDLDSFIGAFEREEPGRHPPVAVRRALLVEAGHRCGICEDGGPFEFHHIIEWNRIRHFDPRHMLPLCGTCHSRCGNGTIDRQSQLLYKQQLQRLSVGPQFLTYDKSPARLSWEDLREVLEALHASAPSSTAAGTSRFDFTTVAMNEKNSLNNLSEDFFHDMVTDYEPYFGRIDDFLANPLNRRVVDTYHELVDDLRVKIAADRSMFATFDQILVRLADMALSAFPDRLRGRMRTLRAILAFMYVNCDIGRKA